MLTKKEISEFRKKLESTKCGEDFMTNFLKGESVRYLKQLEEKIGEKEAEHARKKIYQRREAGVVEDNPQGV